MYYEDIDFAELSEYEREIYHELHEFLTELGEKSVWDIINEYCLDFEYLIFDDTYGGVKIKLIYDYYLYICGDSSLETSDGNYWLSIHEYTAFHTSICDAFEVLYNLGLKKDNIIHA